MMNRINRIVVSLTCVIAIAMISVFSYGWLVDKNVFDFNVNGSSTANYFAGGNGSVDNPYLIAEPVHIYNFSWLQYLDKFDDKTYFKIKDPKNPDGQIVIDMESENLHLKYGAIPPIGTKSKPFKGVFDGNNCVIKNLWVSSIPSQWKQKPIGYEEKEIGNYIGLFGSVNARNADDSVDATVGVFNFYLENLKITSDQAISANVDSTQKGEKGAVGLVAGYANANIQNVGVNNASIDLVGGKTYNSDFSLVGEVGPNAYWEGWEGIYDPNGGAGDGSGGDLVVDPTKDNNIITTAGLNGDYGKVAVVEGANNNAYYSSQLFYAGSLSHLQGIDTRPIFNEDQRTVYTINAAETEGRITSWDFASIDSYDATDKVHLGLNELSNSNNFRGVEILAPIWKNFESTVASLPSGDAIPLNCIYFKPQNAGTVSILAYMNTVNHSNAVGVFKITRNASAAQGYDLSRVLELRGEPGSTTWRLYRGGSYNDESSAMEEDEVVAHDFETKERYVLYQLDVNANEEYVIGNMGTGRTIFCYLILPGVNASEGPSLGDPSTSEAKIIKVDYVYRESVSDGVITYYPSFETEDIYKEQRNKTLIQVEDYAVPTDGDDLFYNMYQNQATADTKHYVYFASYLTSESDTVFNDLIKENSDGKRTAYNSTIFPQIRADSQ